MTSRYAASSQNTTSVVAWCAGEGLRWLSDPVSVWRRWSGCVPQQVPTAFSLPVPSGQPPGNFVSMSCPLMVCAWVWLKALMFGVDFMAAEGSLDMAAAHKHRKRVREWESGRWKGKVTTFHQQLQRWRQKHMAPLTTPFLAFSEKHLPQFEAEKSAARRRAGRSAVSSHNLLPCARCTHTRHENTFRS